ncbi:integrase catalytic domain-containing protein [Trichonephila clavipes]|nr:integrase catalytic domain-containing protein [Trichonephila clavipes]
MDVTQLKTQRKPLRTSFTLSAKAIEEELMKEVPDVDELSILKMQISDKFSRLKKKMPKRRWSAHATGQSSLNDLLYKDPNLIEQIPDILDRFRRYPIGLSADIEKAFLQLGITPKHRDFLRFFYPDEGEEIVYRHCRVVFGVSSSPFLLAAVLAHLLENVPADDTQLDSVKTFVLYR